MPSERSRLLLGLAEAKDAVQDQADEIRRGGARADGGERRSRLQGVVQRAKRGGQKAAEAAKGAGETAVRGGQRSRELAEAYGERTNELRYRRGDLRRRGIPQESGSVSERAVEASIMGPPVNATLEPTTRPQDMQHFVAGTSMRRRPEEPTAAGPDISRMVMLGGGGATEEEGAGALMMDDPLGVGGFGMGDGEDDDMGWF